VLAQQAEDELVLLAVEEGSYFALNEVGARVWELCDGTRDVDQIQGIIGAEFDAPLDVIERDVRGLLEDLAEDHLVTW
jgi:hypothetical protein